MLDTSGKRTLMFEDTTLVGHLQSVSCDFLIGHDGAHFVKFYSYLTFKVINYLNFKGSKLKVINTKF